MAMSSAVLLAAENEKLHMENQRQKKKRAKKRKYIARGGVLLGAEGASLAQAGQTGATEGAVEAAAEQPRQVLRHCSLCKSTEHTKRTCLTRQATS